MGVYLTLFFVFGRVLAYAYLLADILLIFSPQRRRTIHDLYRGDEGRPA